MARQCVSCRSESDRLRVVRRSGGSCCPACRVWVRTSLSRTRKIAKYLIPQVPSDFARVKRARREMVTLLGNERYGRWADEHMPLVMGVFYFGPCDNRAWQTIIDRILGRRPAAQVGIGEPSNPFTMTRIRGLNRSVIMEKMGQLGDFGVICLPSTPMLREQVAHLMIGTYGSTALEQFNASVFCWLASEKEFVGCDRDAWAMGFSLIHQVIAELGEKFSFTDLGYQVTGTSGNVYHIIPCIHAPYYVVKHQFENHLIPVCIDPIGASTCMFSDVLVTLLLSLADDKASAKHIDTLYGHVYGPRRRNGRDVNLLWHRALRANADANGEQACIRPDPNAEEVHRRMRYMINRFQTNLDRWTHFVVPDDEEVEDE